MIATWHTLKPWIKQSKSVFFMVCPHRGFREEGQCLAGPGIWWLLRRLVTRLSGQRNFSGPDGMQGNPEIRKWSRIVNHSTPWIPYHTSDPALEQKPKLPITRDKFGSFTITPYEPKIFEH